MCQKCAYIWKSREDFLGDPFICLVGFQSNFKETEPGHYLFNHISEGNHCDTTLAVEVDAFLSLYKGKMFTHIKFGSQTCEEHCSSVADLAQCPVECKNAVARKIMQAFSHCKIGQKERFQSNIPLYTTAAFLSFNISYKNHPYFRKSKLLQHLESQQYMRIFELESCIYLLYMAGF